MEKKNNIGNGILVVLLFIIICFLIYYVVIAGKGKTDNNIDDNKVNIENKDIQQNNDNSDVNESDDNSDYESNIINNQQVAEDDYDFDAGYIIDDNNIKSEIKSIMEKYYTTVDFNIKCGKKDIDDIYYPNEGSFFPDYIRCLEFDSISDLKQYYDSFLSENFYSKMIELSFVEHDDKLYCLAHHTAPYTYEKGSFYVQVVRKDNDVINAIGVYKTEENGLYPEYTFAAKMRFIYSNNHLALDKYDEEMMDN